MTQSIWIPTLIIITHFVPNNTYAQDDNIIQLFDFSEYSAPPSKERHWEEIYDSETIRAGYYHLKVGAKDDQSPHDFDEVYWIAKGQSKIRIGESDFNIKKGDVIYVQAKQTHYFHEITETLDILVLFSKANFDVTESPDQINSYAQLIKAKDSKRNIWHNFLKKKSMTFGLYLLPKSTGGDQALTHHFNEINFVVNGDATFTAGKKQIEVKPGSLFVVKKNTPHYFETKRGIDVFILFENKSVQ